MVVKTKSMFVAVDTEKDGTRVLITDHTPRPPAMSTVMISYDKWLPELSASKELMWKWRREEIDYDEFKRLFLEEINNNPNALNRIKDMTHYVLNGHGSKRDRKRGNVTLLCACHSSAFWCHRLIVKDLIEQQINEIKTKSKLETEERRK